MEYINTEKLKKIYDYNIFEMRIYLHMYKTRDETYRLYNKVCLSRIMCDYVTNRYSYLYNFKETIKDREFEKKISYIDIGIKLIKELFNEFCMKYRVINYYDGFNNMINLLEELYNYRIELIKNEYGN